MQSIQVQSNQLEMGLKVISSDKRGFLDLSLNFTSIVGPGHNYEMKLINIFLPRSKTYVYAIEELDKIYLYTCHSIQKKSIRLRCRKRKCRRNLTLQPINKLRY